MLMTHPSSKSKQYTDCPLLKIWTVRAPVGYLAGMNVMHEVGTSFSSSCTSGDNPSNLLLYSQTVNSIRNTCREGFLHAEKPCAPGVGAALLHSVLSALLPCLVLLLDALHLLQPVPIHSIYTCAQVRCL